MEKNNEIACPDEFMQGLFNEYKRDKDNLIQMLNAVQEHYGYVPREAQKALSEFLGISMAEIYGVVTFYSRFSLEPQGKYKLSVCLGTACYVKGSQALLDKIEDVLGIKNGDVTKDGKFSISACRCVGACGLAPVLTVGEDVHGRLTKADVPGILAKYMD